MLFLTAFLILKCPRYLYTFHGFSFVNNAYKYLYVSSWPNGLYDKKVYSSLDLDCHVFRLVFSGSNMANGLKFGLFFKLFDKKFNHQSNSYFLSLLDGHRL